MYMELVRSNTTERERGGSFIFINSIKNVKNHNKITYL